jgi:flagellar motor switch protein FliN/FliY
MSEKSNVNIDSSINDIKVQISVEIGRTEKTLRDIRSMTDGDILELDSLAGEPVNVFANNVLVAKGEVIVIDDQFGVRIIDLVGKKEIEQSEE